MKKIITLLSLISVSLIYGQDGAPANPYYNGFNWNQTGTALKNALATFKINKMTEIFLGYSDKHLGIMAQLYVFEN